MSSEAPGGHSHHSDDERTLHKLGYAQVLYREMGGFSNFAISFTIISILAGCLTSYFIAFNDGGPVAVTWGWLIVGGFVILVALIFVPDHHQSASFVFTKTLNASGFSGHNFSSPVFWFVFGIGLLMAQYTYTGYDASAHMSEETRSASRAAALGVVMSVVIDR